MKRDITEILNQLVCVGPLHEVPKAIPGTARAIEKFVVVIMCNKLDVRINNISAAQHFNSLVKGHEKPLIFFKKQLMADYNITEKDLTEKAIKVEPHG